MLSAYSAHTNLRRCFFLSAVQVRMKFATGFNVIRTILLLARLYKVQGPPARDKCTMVINEATPDNPGIHDRHEFIEIRFNSPSNAKPLLSRAGRKLMLVKGLSSGRSSGHPVVELSAPLKDLNYPVAKSDYYYVLADSNRVMPEGRGAPQMLFSDKSVQQTRKCLSGPMQRFVQGNLRNGNQLPIGIIRLQFPADENRMRACGRKLADLTPDLVN